MTLGIDQFIEELDRSGLVPKAEIQALLAGHSVPGITLDEDGLARLLEGQKRLTPFQTAAVRAGAAKTLVLGNYLLLDRLGAGGMGQVFLAQHRRMKRQVAIKVLPRDKMNSPEQVDRFQREVEAAARLSHPNIVAAFDADEGPLGHFLVMEYVAGCDAARFVSERGPLPVREAVDYALQTARALEYAHGQGIVHRDIKPANLLRDLQGTIKVTDMGLARFTSAALSGASKAGLTLDGAIGGTAEFMAPEQAVNTKNADERADIYSLGCSLYYMLTAQVPYPGSTLMEMLLAHRDQPVRSLRQPRVDVPQALDAVYQRMTAKKPADRYASARALISDLESCELPGGGETISPAASAAVTVEPAPTSWHSGNPITLYDVSLLLVEPSRVQSRVILGQLQELSMRRIQTAASGQQAEAILRETRPDLVLCSMHLPDMTGADLVQRMRRAEGLSRTAFVLISSETDKQFLEPVRQSGTAAILPKPFDRERLRLALTAAVDAFSPEVLRLHNLNLPSLRVLIVDDSRSARKHIRRVLENLGVKTITEAPDGREASELLRAKSFDLVVSDFNMPHMDGPTFVRRLRQDQRHHDVPILMITSEEDPARLAEAQAAGVSALCNKVFDPKAVCDILESLLQQFQGSPRANP